MMRSVVCTAFGEPETLTMADRPEPVAGAGELRIAVAAAGVNFADILMVGGSYQECPEFPFSPGLEIAGTVLECGAGVTGFAPGDRVMAGCGNGGFAEQVALPAGDAYRLPDSMPFKIAGGFPVAYGTAYGALAWRAHLEAGETLLVLGAAGGVGLTAVEVGKAMGATVIATARGREKLAVAQEHGADHPIDTGTEDVRAEVRRIAGKLGKQGAEVVFDPVGGALFEASLRCVAWGARLVVIGFAAGKVQQIPANILLVKNVSAIGFYWGSYRARAPELVASGYAQLFAWYAAGKLRPHVSHQLDLAEAGAALGLLKSRKSTGKVILTTGRG